MEKVFSRLNKRLFTIESRLKKFWFQTKNKGNPSPTIRIPLIVKNRFNTDSVIQRTIRIPI